MMGQKTVRYCLFICLFMCLVMFPVSAQDNPPWPPDPETLFAPSVEVVSVEETESTTETINCGLSSHRNGGWVYHLDGDQVQLCNIDTGETQNLSPLTPEEVGYLPNEFNRAFLSPDETWLVYAHDVAVPETNGQRVVSSYRLADGHINLLGTLDLPTGLNHPNVKGLGRWLSDTRGTMMLDILGDSVADDYFIYDVTQPDSLKPVGSGFYDYYADPPRYEEVITTDFVAFRTSLSGHYDCLFSLQDARGSHELNLGYDCIGARVLYGGGQYLTLQVEAEDSTTSNLLRFDPHTDERSILLTDEIEWLVGVSPDGRYALLLMDDNGQLDLAHEDFILRYVFGTYYGNVPVEPPARFIVWDTEQGEIVYESIAPMIPDIEQIKMQYAWCGDDCLVYAHTCVDYAVLPITLLRFDENQETTSQNLDAGCYDVGLEDWLLFSPDKRHIFHSYPPVSLIEGETGTSYPLFAEAYRENYRVYEAEWLADETLKVWLVPTYMRQPAEMAYTLRVTALFDTANEP